MVFDRKEYMKNYYQTHKEYFKEYDQTEQRKTYMKNYKKIYMKPYLQTHKDYISQQRKKRDKKHKAKHRQLGFIPLNKWFTDSEAHHIDFEYVVFIPKELHTSIRHNIWTGKNMNDINAKVFDWLFG